jgi:hypothetical protein
MSDFILLLIAGAAWTWGFFCIFRDGYFLAPIGNLLRKTLPTSPETYAATWYTKPLFDCPPCMSSLYGLSISAGYFHFHILEMIVYVVCLCGVNFVIKSILFPEYE